VSELINYFSETCIINLPDRADRRRQMESELRKLGSISAGQVRFVPAIRPKSKDDWPSIGARGCFLSHYSVLKQALERELESVLILEDDCKFRRIDESLQTKLVNAVAKTEWDILYLGHVLPIPGDREFELILSRNPILTAHMYAVKRSCLNRLVKFLEQLMQREEGHPDGGPQHYDGALSTFRFQNPDIKTLVCMPPMARQRSSRSDITTGFLDTVPIVRTAVKHLRHIKNLMVQ